MKNDNGTIVYPGFPADLLYTFRVASVAAQVILWATIGLTFGALAERLAVAESPVRDRPVPALGGVTT